MAEIEKKYFAFISYSRKDKLVAEWLQRKIEHFRYPTALVAQEDRPDHPKYVRKIFLDKNELEISDANFRTDIEHSLKNSRYLILLCSPNSAASPWVKAEIEYFLATHENKKYLVLPVILEGKGISEIFSGEFEEYRNDFQSRNLPDFRKVEKETQTQTWELGLVKILAYILRVGHTQIHDRFKAEKTRALKITIFWFLIAMLAISGVGYLAYKAEVKARVSGEFAALFEDKAKEAELTAVQKAKEASAALEAEKLAKEEAEKARLSELKAQEEAEIAKQKAQAEAAEAKHKAEAQALEARRKAEEETLKAEKKAAEEAEKARLKYEEELLKSQLVEETIRAENSDILIKKLADNPKLGDSDFLSLLWLSLSHVGEKIQMFAISKNRNSLENERKSDAEILEDASLVFNVAWSFPKKELSSKEVGGSIKRGLPILIEVPNSEGLAPMYARTKKRAAFKNIKDWEDVLNAEPLEAGKKIYPNYWGLIYGYNEKTDEVIFYLKSQQMAAKLDELKGFVSNAFFPLMVRPKNLEEENKDVQVASSAKGHLPNYFSKNMKAELKGNFRVLPFEDYYIANQNANLLEALFSVYSYLGCKTDLNSLQVLRKINANTSDQKFLENIGRLLNVNWHFDTASYLLSSTEIEKILGQGVPLILVLRNFSNDKFVWDIMLKERKFNPTKTTADLDLPLASFRVAGGVKYAVLYGYNEKQKKYLFNYCGTDFAISLLELKFMSVGLCAPYYRISLSR